MSQGKTMGRQDIWTRYDDRSLIYESFHIEGIRVEECRSIFLDWSLGLPDHVPHRQAASALVEEIPDHYADHPMSELLRTASQVPSVKGGRKGGRKRGMNSS